MTFDDLDAYRTADPFQQAVLARAGELLAATDTVKRLDALSIVVVDFLHAPAAVRDLYFTPNCVAIRNENGIVVNSAFLRDAEIAIRAFGISQSVFTTPFLRSDADISGLARRVRTQGDGYLSALRTLTGPDAEKDRLDELALALVFFAGHEIGHLRTGDDRRAFGEVLADDKPLESRLAVATSKYCRHVDELAKFGFDLPMFEDANDRTSKLRAAATAVASTRPSNEIINETAWFDAETAADDLGIATLLDALRAEAAPAAGHALALRALFAVSVVSWYGDLVEFMERIAPDRPFNAGVLAAKLMTDRENYVRASSLFGSEHRFVLLRACLAMSKVIAQSPDGDSKAPRLQRAHLDAVQRCQLLRQLMDTAVKLATMGASTPWLLDESAGGEKVIFMSFEPLGNELRRLQQRLSAR